MPHLLFVLVEVLQIHSLRVKGQTLTVTLQEHHAQHHAQGVQVELLRRAVPRESSPEVAHPHAGQHHRRQAHQLRRPHQPREGGAAGTCRGVVHLLQGGGGGETNSDYRE